MSTTFSQLIDDIVFELKRPDLRTEIAAYTNQTIREVHMRPAVNAPILFDANRIEEELVVDTADPYLWTIPSVTRFQKLELMRCKDLGLIIEQKSPRVLATWSTEPWANFGWYRTGPAHAVSGVGVGQILQVSYFMFPLSLKYKAVADRRVIWNSDRDWYETPEGSVPTDLEIELEVNWILARWEHVVREGVRAKIHKRLGDELRMRTAFSSYEQSRTGLWNTEPAT